ITGFFSIRNGKHLETPRGSATTYHNKYMTAILCISGARLNTEIRVYSPPGDVILKDGTIVFTIAKAFFPPKSNAILDAIEFAPFPGDPAAPDYEAPITPVPFLWPLETMSSIRIRRAHWSMSLCFSLRLSLILIRCIYDGTTRRWVSTQIPWVNTCISFRGSCCDLSPSGVLQINLNTIVLNIAPRGTASVPTSDSHDSPSPLKRKCFSASASDTLDAPA
ncbi:hypothetical protein FB451DRAFT_994456, partial [Mycena latifolia]